MMKKSILKSFILHPSEKKWTMFSDLYTTVLSERDKVYDEAFAFIKDFYHVSRVFPTFTSIQTELQATQETQLLAFFTELENNPEYLPINSEDADFFARTEILRKNFYEGDLYGTVSTFGADLQNLAAKDLPSYLKTTEEFIAKLHKIKDKATHSDATTSGILYGDTAVLNLQKIYQSIQEKKQNEESLYYNLGWKRMEHVKITRGDLIVIGGFTSHGKSVLLRNLVYRFLTEYGMNCFYCTLEMSYEHIQILFNILHANNKKRYPGTPRISFEKFKEGLLSPEELSLLWEAAHDLANNDNYGTLYLEYPNKSRYRLSDIKSRVIDLENSIMPVHVCAVDYLTLLYPVDSDKMKPDTQDYNLMVKEFKNMGLSHRSCDGKPSPMITMTPAQISRKGLEEAIKNANQYDLSALRQYTELEGSADIVLTTMLMDDMRQAQEMQLQNLKNRSGKIFVDPVKLHVDLDFGFTITEIKQKSEAERIQTIKSLNI